MDGKNKRNKEVEYPANDGTYGAKRGIHDVPALVFQPDLQRIEKFVPVNAQQRISKREFCQFRFVHGTEIIDKSHDALWNHLYGIYKFGYNQYDNTDNDSKDDDKRNHKRNGSAQLLQNKSIGFLPDARFKEAQWYIQNQRKKETKDQRLNQVYNPGYCAGHHIHVLDAKID